MKPDVSALSRLASFIPESIVDGLRSVAPAIGREKRYVRYRGSLLPHRRIRLPFGPPFDDNRYFLESGLADAAKLTSKCGLNSGSTILDVGCGIGRIAIALLKVKPARYVGFDVDRPCVEWCREHIEQRHPSFRFVHVDVVNERYNPGGAGIGSDFRFPMESAAADVVLAWGVLTNLEPEHVPVYLSEMKRVLKPGGKVFLTAFVEDEVPAASKNPSDYVSYECRGPLHVVRYERGHLFAQFQAHGLVVDEFVHHGGAHCNQSEIYLVKSSRA